MDKIISWVLDLFETTKNSPIFQFFGGLFLLIAATLYLIGRSKEVELKEKEICALKEKIQIFNPETLEKYYEITIKQMEKILQKLSIENKSTQHKQKELLSQIEKIEKEKSINQKELQELKEKYQILSKENKAQKDLLKKAEKEKQKSISTFTQSKELIECFNSTTGSDIIGTATTHPFTLDEELYSFDQAEVLKIYPIDRNENNAKLILPHVPIPPSHSPKNK